MDCYQPAHGYWYGASDYKFTIFLYWRDSVISRFRDRDQDNSIVRLQIALELSRFPDRDRDNSIVRFQIAIELPQFRDRDRDNSIVRLQIALELSRSRNRESRISLFRLLSRGHTASRRGSPV